MLGDFPIYSLTFYLSVKTDTKIPNTVCTWIAFKYLIYGKQEDKAKLGVSGSVHTSNL